MALSVPPVTPSTPHGAARRWLADHGRLLRMVAMLAGLIVLCIAAVVVVRRVAARPGDAAQRAADGAQSPTQQLATLEGTLEATEVDVSSKIPGRVAEMLVDEGDVVESGQVLALLESKEVDAKVEQATAMESAARALQDQAAVGVELQGVTAGDQVHQAEAGYRAASATLSKALHGARPTEIKQVEAAVEQARQAYETASTAHDEQVKQAEAGLGAAKAKLEMALSGARPQEIEQVEKAVEAANAQYDTARATYERFQGLYEEGVIPEQKKDEITMTYLQAKAQKEGAEAKLSLVREGARKEEIAQAQEGVRAAEAQLRLAKGSTLHLAARAQWEQAKAKLSEVRQGARAEDVQLAHAGRDAAAAQLQMARDARRQVELRQKEHLAAMHKADAARGQVDEALAYKSETQLVAPVSGYVSQRMSSTGEMVSAGFPMLTIAKDEDLKVKVWADESQFGHLQLNDRVTIVLPALGDLKVAGEVVRVSQGADFAIKKATNEAGSFDVRSLEVVVRVLDRDPRMRIGMTARVQIPISKGPA